ncbi:MAG TPA: HAMP domain-containing sensor histidine kinase [Burkholderiaceae bacterium]|nr:HAMP domain-containing sensor histidine kinase [Burkholderiaceae bacterium]
MRRWRLPGRVPLRLRVLFRGVFALLALAMVALALSVLQDEKQRSHRVYAEGLKRNQAQIAARLRHPTGQLALLNPAAADRPAQPVHPVLLPFAALDFDDRAKAFQAVEMAGCALQYPNGATMCAAIGSNPYAGGFVYLVASLAVGELSPHASGDLLLADVHRVRVDLDYRGEVRRWIAPYELSPDGRGRLTGYTGDAPLAFGVRPVRDFRGWLWQEGRCVEPQAEMPGCLRRTYLSVRLPVEVFRDALVARNPIWPPPDLDRMTIRLQLLAPGDAPPVFDSDSPGATPAFSLSDLRTLLLPGEQLTVQREGATKPLFTLTGARLDDEPVSPWVAQVIRRLPVEGFDAPVQAREAIDTPQGRYTLVLGGDIRSVNRALAAVATRLAWTVGAMLLAVALTWAVIELFVIRRITLLTRRAAEVSVGVRGEEGLASLDLSDLRGSDELGVLAQGLKDLLQRVNADMRREQIRARQEKDMWHAVGHEIMSPLQSLMALHGAPEDPSVRYITRMQQAVRVLYGQASPSEAFAATTLTLEPMDLCAFLGHVARNARYIGIDDVRYDGPGEPLMVRANEHSLEDVVTHVLRNADRHRTPGTPIRIGVETDEQGVSVALHNTGAPIPEGMLERIFEYGVSGAAPQSDAQGRRGQGLFVARTYMAKLGGTIVARNTGDGVSFILTLPRASA